MLAIPEDGCEMRLLGTSPGLSKDYFLSAMPDYCPPSYFEEEIAAEVNISCGPDFHERNLLYSEYTSTSCGTSVTSDFSEDSYFDNDEDFDLFNENVNQNSTLKSKMNSEDQLQSIEYLTRVVSTTLGLREQLDIIRIISPDATVSSTDTEFFIDLDAFNDIKFQQLKLYVSEHVSSNSCKKCSESRQKQNSSKGSPSSHPKYSKVIKVREFFSYFYVPCVTTHCCYE
ncbi:Protein FAM199X-B [Exaiptasia diaphana]|nr:Protein FAM199X-B [Exaiptasia diaphana]